MYILYRTFNLYTLSFQYCCNNHLVYKWCTQPVMNRGVHAGDMMIAATTLFSGNNFGKLHLWAKFMNLGFLNTRSFSRMQTFYCVPSIEETWEKNQKETYVEYKDQEIVVLGKSE